MYVSVQYSAFFCWCLHWRVSADVDLRGVRVSFVYRCVCVFACVRACLYVGTHNKIRLFSAFLSGCVWYVHLYWHWR